VQNTHDLISSGMLFEIWLSPAKSNLVWNASWARRKNTWQHLW